MKNLYAIALAIGCSVILLAVPASAAPTEVQGSVVRDSQGEPGAQGPRVRRAFSAADRNQDGFVDRAEWEQQRDLIFQRLDTDKDGRLSREEMQQGRPQAARPRAEAQGASASVVRQDRFSRLDTDKDGFVSRAEFNAASDQIFARCDKNGDGRIARGECRGSGGQRDAARARRRTEPAVQ